MKTYEFHFIWKKEKLFLSNKNNESFMNNPINNNDKYSIYMNEDFSEQSKNRIIKEMPFLKLPAILTNFHRTNQGKYKLLIIEIICLLLLVFFISIRYKLPTFKINVRK